MQAVEVSVACRALPQYCQCTVSRRVVTRMFVPQAPGRAHKRTPHAAQSSIRKIAISSHARSRDPRHPSAPSPSGLGLYGLIRELSGSKHVEVEDISLPEDISPLPSRHNVSVT